MTELDLLRWYKTNVSQYIQTALSSNVGVIYTESWLTAISVREVGSLLYGMIKKGMTVEQIIPHLKGDFNSVTQIYSGYGFTQIDIRSFPQFISSNDWLDPVKCFNETISVLETMRKRLEVYNHISPQNMPAAITASYNAGAGNIIKALQKGLPIDTYTYGKNYSSDVLRIKVEYEGLFP